LVQSCITVFALGVALVLGLCGSCFLFFGVVGLGSLGGNAGADDLGGGLMMAAIGAALLFGAFLTLRAAFKRRS
jgi:hypothetical protein